MFESDGLILQDYGKLQIQVDLSTHDYELWS